MFRALSAMLLLLTIVLAGCSSLGCGDPHPYINSPSQAPLKAPEGLSIPAPDPAYTINNAAAPVPGKANGRDAAGVCLINPPRVLPVGNATKPATVAAPAVSHGAPSQTPPPPAKSAGQSQTPATTAGTVMTNAQVLAVTVGMQ